MEILRAPFGRPKSSRKSVFFIAFLEFSADFIFFIFYFTENFGNFSKSFFNKKEETFSDPVVENCHYVVKKKHRKTEREVGLGRAIKLLQRHCATGTMYTLGRKYVMPHLSLTGYCH